jgi:ankyrin repeat protein
MKNIKNFNQFLNEELHILKGPSDEEYNDAIKDLSAEELYDKCKNFYNENLLQTAVDKGLFENKKPNKILEMSVEVGSLRYIKYALNKGANVNYSTRGKDHFTMIGRASYNNNIEVAKYLIDNGADINGRCKINSTPLSLACFWGYEEMIHFLVDNGADVNLLDDNGNTPLIIYLYSGIDKNIVEYLVENGTDINIKNNNDLTALDIAKDNQIKDYLQNLE